MAAHPHAIDRNVMQRDLSLNVKEAVFKVGFVFIMMLLAFAIFNDISRYARG